MSRPLADESAYRALAHPARRRALDYLKKGDRTVAELIPVFDLSKQAVSHHLRILRSSGLVQQERKGRSRVYRIHPNQLRDIHQWLASYAPLWNKPR